MKNKIILPLTFFIFTFASNIFAQKSEAKITFDDLLKACQQIAEVKPHKRVDKAIAGREVDIDGKTYEIRFFSFEDPSNNLPANINFGEYIKSRKLGNIAATHMKYMPGIEFEVFDYRFTKLEDGVYFSMALRAL